MLKNNFNKAFFHCKMSAREVTIFEEKSKLVIFHLKFTKANYIVCNAEHQTLTIIPQVCLIFRFKVFELPPLHINFFFGHSYFINEPIFRVFAVLFTTFLLHNDDMVIFFLWCCRKVRF